jgi:hypothetical protein
MGPKEVYAYLSGLLNLSYSEERFNQHEVRIGAFNILDFWKSKGKILLIDVDFTDSLDLSKSKWEEITLVGMFNRVDLSESRVRKLNIEKAKIIKLDVTEAEIAEIIKEKSQFVRF